MYWIFPRTSLKAGKIPFNSIPLKEGPINNWKSFTKTTFSISNSVRAQNIWLLSFVVLFLYAVYINPTKIPGRQRQRSVDIFQLCSFARNWPVFFSILRKLQMYLVVKMLNFNGITFEVVCWKFFKAFKWVLDAKQTNSFAQPWPVKRVESIWELDLLIFN